MALHAERTQVIHNALRAQTVKSAIFDAIEITQFCIVKRNLTASSQVV